MIPQLQFARAHALAAAHGHWWAGVVEPRPRGWTAEDLDAALYASAIETPPGWVGLSYRTAHVTGTRRLAWSVAEDGTTVLRGSRRGEAVGRPGDESATVALATVDPHGRVSIRLPMGLRALSGGVVEALLWALRALLGSEEAAMSALGAEILAVLTDGLSEEAYRVYPLYVPIRNWVEGRRPPARLPYRREPVRQL